MFSTCLFCHASLGANDAIEQFPVGKRLAFDGERGRLWAVCPRCARWNLAPIEERWEALDACEKAYRAATQRVSTDNIALARVRDGTDLVRIGRPLLPEYAAWRYGDVVRERRRRSFVEHYGGMVVGAVAAGGIGAAMATGIAPGAVFSPLLIASGGLAWWRGHATERRFRAALPGRKAVARRLSTHHMRLRLGRAEDGTWVIEERRAYLDWWRGPKADPRAVRLTGAAARAALPPVLAAIMPWGGNAVEVRQGADLFERAPDAEVLFDTIANRAWLGSESYRGALSMARPESMLALEMALHDEDERRALAGELGALYARWEEAERVARIADGELTRLAASE